MRRIVAVLRVVVDPARQLQPPDHPRRPPSSCRAPPPAVLTRFPSPIPLAAPPPTGPATVRPAEANSALPSFPRRGAVPPEDRPREQDDGPGARGGSDRAGRLGDGPD